MARTEGQILADMMDKTRQLTRSYISNLRAADPYTSIQQGDKTFNSIYWLAAHLVWAEDHLANVATTGLSIAPDWIRHYHLGADGSLHEGHGDIKSLLDEMKRVHEQTLQHIRSLTDADLDRDNTLGISFGEGDESIRMMLMHAIRHEGTHVGHLGWLCKMNGVKVI